MGRSDACHRLAIVIICVVISVPSTAARLDEHFSSSFTSPLPSVPAGVISWTSATWSSLEPSDINLATVHIPFTITPRTANIVISNAFAGPTGTSISVWINDQLAFANITQYATGTPAHNVILGPPVNYMVIHDQTGEQLATGTSWAEQLDEVITMSVASAGAVSFSRATAGYRCAFKISGDDQWFTSWKAPTNDYGVDCVIKKPLSSLTVQLVEIQRAWTVFGTQPIITLDHTGGAFDMVITPWFTAAALTNTSKTELYVGDGVTIGGAFSVPVKYQCLFALPGGPPVVSVTSDSVTPADFSSLTCILPGQITSVLGAVTGTILRVTLQAVSADGSQVTSVAWRASTNVPTFTFNAGGAPSPPVPSSTGSGPTPDSSSGGSVDSSTGGGGEPDDEDSGGSVDSTTSAAIHTQNSSSRRLHRLWRTRYQSLDEKQSSLNA